MEGGGCNETVLVVYAGVSSSSTIPGWGMDVSEVSEIEGVVSCSCSSSVRVDAWAVVIGHEIVGAAAEARATQAIALSRPPPPKAYDVGRKGDPTFFVLVASGQRDMSRASRLGRPSPTIAVWAVKFDTLLQ